MTDPNTIQKTVFFNASQETVWEFLTDKDRLGEWYHPAVANLEEGTNYTMYRKTDPEKVPLIWGRVLEVNSPSRLVTTFCIDPFEDRETTLTWVLEPSNGGTKLTLTHEGVVDAAGDAVLGLLLSLDAGWDGHFGQLRDSVKADD